jgi:glyoxylase-like metal-dependent hydrolase (beta-lactamase superfamily II)
MNADLVETPRGVVLDSTLTISDARALRERAAELGKPLRAVLITHAHPDHYGGTVEVVGVTHDPRVGRSGRVAAQRGGDPNNAETSSQGGHP